MTYPTAHSAATSFDRLGLGLAGVAASFIQDARLRQRDLDDAQAHRNISAARRAVHAVERQRRELIASQQEAARLRAESDRLADELARMRSRALEAEGRLVRLAKDLRNRGAA